MPPRFTLALTALAFTALGPATPASAQNAANVQVVRDYVDEVKLAENYAAALDEVLRLKPSSSKGRYIKKITFSTTMGPGVQVDPNRTRNVASEDESGE